ncbi:MAG TPA: DUF4328 domain-containing protein [Chthoniobacterales bacterium]|jgi:hypothetical protein|nr:DUF4328 domain-containing protein [Chthoniobacterales bacterium]
MGAIYLRYPDGQRTKRSEEETRRLWSGGLMPSGTIYWQEGMSEWRPVTEWLGDRPPTAPLMVQPVLEAESYQFVVDPTALTKFLRALLCANVVVACLALIVDLGELVRVQLGQLTPDQLASNDPMQGVVGLLQAGLGLVSGIVFLRWVYRAYKNIQGFGAEGLRFSPGWAVGYYFIPFLSLIRPAQVMSEIWRVSQDPQNWMRRRGSWLVGTWWALFLLYSVATQVSLELALDGSTNDQWWLAAIFAILGDLFSVPLSIVALRLITEIYKHQKNLVERAH